MAGILGVLRGSEGVDCGAGVGKRVFVIFESLGTNILREFAKVIWHSGLLLVLDSIPFAIVVFVVERLESSELASKECVGWVTLKDKIWE